MPNYPDLAAPAAPSDSAYPDLSSPTDSAEAVKPDSGYPDLAAPKKEALLGREDIRAFGKHILGSLPQLKSVNLPLELSGKTAQLAGVEDPLASLYKDSPEKDKMYELTGYAALGVSSGRLFNSPELVSKLTTGRELFEPGSEFGQLAYGVGSLVGAYPTIRWLQDAWGFNEEVALAKGLGRWLPTSPWGVWAKEVAKQTVSLGTYSMLSEWGGENISEVAKNKAGAGLHGAWLGTLFATVGTMVSKEHPIMSAAMRFGMLEANALWGTKDAPLSNKIFETGLAALFSAYTVDATRTAASNLLRKTSGPGLQEIAGLQTEGGDLEAPLTKAFLKETQKMYGLKDLELSTIEGKLRQIGDLRKVPANLKWTYIMLTTPIRPTGETVDIVSATHGHKYTSSTPGRAPEESGPGIFEMILKKRSDRLLADMSPESLASPIDTTAGMTEAEYLASGTEKTRLATKTAAVAAASTKDAKLAANEALAAQSALSSGHTRGYAEANAAQTAARSAEANIREAGAVRRATKAESARAAEEAQIADDRLRFYVSREVLDKEPGTGLYYDMKMMTGLEGELEAQFGRHFRNAIVMNEPVTSTVVPETRQTGHRIIKVPHTEALLARTGPGKVVGPKHAIFLSGARTGMLKLNYKGEVDIAQPVMQQVYTVEAVQGRAKDGSKNVIASKEFTQPGPGFKGGEVIQTKFDHGDASQPAETRQYLWREMINAGYKNNKSVASVKGQMLDVGGAVLKDEFGATFYSLTTGETLTKQRAIDSVNANSRDVGFFIDLRTPEFTMSKVGMDAPNLSWIPKELAAMEEKWRYEIATGADIKELQMTARAAKVIYKAKSGEEMFDKFNSYLMDMFGLNNTKQLEKLTKGEVEFARQVLKSLRPDKDGNVWIPKSKEIMPASYFDDAKYRDQKGKIYTREEAAMALENPDPNNPIEFSPKKMSFMEWFQTSRSGVREVYDLYKPKELDHRQALDERSKELDNIFEARIKKNSVESEHISMYTDGKIGYNDLTPLERDITNGIIPHMRNMVAEMVSNGIIPEDAIKWPNYRNVMEKFVLDKLHGSEIGFLDWQIDSMGPKLPLPRRGVYERPYDIIKDVERYTYAWEQYKAYNQVNETARTLVNSLYRGSRKTLANLFIDHMNGIPSDIPFIGYKQFDEGINRPVRDGLLSIRDTTARLLDRAGLSEAARNTRAWTPTDKPVQGVSSTLARFYYFRFIGGALDTSAKNAFQWEHAAARVGWDNIEKAMATAYTPQGQSLIEQMRVQEEGISRTHRLVQEADDPGPGRGKFDRIEDAGYYTWQKADEFTRNIAGLAGFYRAQSMGLGRAESIEYGHKISLETQFGYTRADSLVMDMISPISRFILFKKWPLAKVEMVRSWWNGGHKDAVINLLMQDWMIYNIAKHNGVNMASFFNGPWQLIMNGLAGPADMIPFANEVKTVMTGVWGDNTKDKEKAERKLVNIWRGSGMRYGTKLHDAWDTMMNHWEVRDVLNHSLVRMSDPKEVATGLVFQPQAKTDFYDNENHLRQIDSEVNSMTVQIERLMVQGKFQEANDLQQKRDEKYRAELLFDGKALQPVTVKDAVRRAISDNTPQNERTLKGLPGKSLIKRR